MSSPKILELIPAIAQTVGAIKKSGYNSAQKYKYRSYEDLVNAFQKPMFDHGVILSVEVVGEHYSAHTKKNDSGYESITYRTCLRVKFSLRCVSDSSAIESTVCGEGMDNGDKATAKAHTMAFKTCFSQVFLIPFEDLPDVESDSETQGQPSKPVVPNTGVDKQAVRAKNSVEQAPSPQAVSGAQESTKGKADHDLGYSGFKQSLDIFEELFPNVESQASATRQLIQLASLKPGSLFKTAIGEWYQKKGAKLTSNSKGAPQFNGIKVDDQADLHELFRVIRDGSD